MSRKHTLGKCDIFLSTSEELCRRKKETFEKENGRKNEKGIVSYKLRPLTLFLMDPQIIMKNGIYITICTKYHLSSDF